ncbi:hypothetical protein V8E54_006173 [Elaphomyces granulatus]
MHTYRYTLGEVVGHDVVDAILPNKYGTSSTASVAIDMLRSFSNNIRIGLYNDGRYRRWCTVRQVFQYGLGKTIRGQGFQPTGFLNQPPTVLRAVNGLKAKYATEGHQLYEEAINGILEKKTKTAHGRSSDIQGSFMLAMQDGFMSEPTRVVGVEGEE